MSSNEGKFKDSTVVVHVEKYATHREYSGGSSVGGCKVSELGARVQQIMQMSPSDPGWFEWMYQTDPTFHAAVDMERGLIVAFLRDSGRQIVAEYNDPRLVPLDVAEADIAADYIEKRHHHAAL